MTTGHLPDVGAAARTADEIKRRWRAGEPADAASALRRYPSLAAYKSVVIDLAYEEYCLREEAGAAPDPAAFAARFPAFGGSIAKVLDGHRRLARHPGLLAPPDWPAADGRWDGLDLVGELGRGAFGRAYLAFDSDTARVCVLKLTTAGAGEARTMGRLRHPHVSDVYWARAAGRLTGVCMPLLGASTLQDVRDAAFPPGGAYPKSADVILSAIDPAGLAPPEVPPGGPVVVPGRPYPVGVAAIGARVAAALVHVHQAGLTHGDLKPSNVVLGAGGHPYLIDFNLASEAADALRCGGTLPYMAPELLTVLAGEARTPPAHPEPVDVYALGATLFELLTGGVPFPPAAGGTEGAAELLARVRRERPNVRAVAPGVPAALAAVVERCLAADPTDRPPAARVQKDLERLTGRRFGVRAAVLTAAAGVAVLVAVSLTWLPSSPTAAPVAEPGTPDEYLARGVEHLHAGRLSLALTDLALARPGPDRPAAAAMLAYGLARVDQPAESVRVGRNAVRWGAGTPAVLNNLGYCLTRTGEPAQAVPHLATAVEAAPDLRQARFNLAVARFHAGVTADSGLPDRAAADDMTAALRMGTATAAENEEAARVYAASAAVDPSLRAEAVRCLSEAVGLGAEPSKFLRDPVLTRRLGDEPGFADVCRRPRSLGPPVPPHHARRLVEPPVR